MMCKNRYTTKLMSWFILASMCISMFSTVSFAELNPYTFDDDLYLYYDFENVSEDTGIVPDLTGNGRNAVAAADEGAYEIIDASINGNNVKAISIHDGTEEKGANAESAYVQLPATDLSTFGGLTVSCWVNLRQAIPYQRVWDIGADGDKYLYLIADGTDTYKAAITKSGWADEVTCESTSPSAISLDKWVLTTFTFDNSTGSMRLYQNGDLVGSNVSSGTKLGDIGNAAASYIGRGQFDWDSRSSLAVADFRIYDRALNGSEIAELAGKTEFNPAQGDLDVLSLGDLSALTQNITLPAEGINGSSITWESSVPDVLSGTGIVTRPEPDEEDVSGILTAHAESGSYTGTREFSFTVKKKPDTLQEELYLHYDFENVDSTIIPDVTSGGRAGRINQDGGNGFEIIDADIYGQSQKALSLTGGDGGSYVELPGGLLEGFAEVTVSCWVRMKGTSGYQRIWDIGKGTNAYMYLLTDGYNEGFVGYSGAITKGGWSQEQGMSKGVSLEQDKWIFTTVTFNDETHTFSLYENGILIGQKTDCAPILSNIGPTTKNWIGYGQFGDTPANMDVADFRIYNYELSGDEIRNLCGLEDEDYAESDKASLSIGDLSAVTESIDLPATGKAGSTITWESSNPAIAGDGTVTRPPKDTADATGVLTATVTYGGYSTTREFVFTVLALPNDLQIINHDLSVLDLGDLSAVREDIPLPSMGEWGSAFTWHSGSPAFLSNGGKISRPPVGYDAKTVILTVTAASGHQQAKKEFSVRILPQFAVSVIESYEPITVMTKVNVLPALPNIVTVTYTNGVKAQLKVQWTNITNIGDYTDGQSFEVKGVIVDTDYQVNATVLVSGEPLPVPADPLATLFDLSDVSLDGDNILTQNAGRDYGYLKFLDNDRMLYNFRSAFGVDTKGVQPLGGWDSPTGLLRGHSTGHYISALALAYASSKDSELKEKLDDMIHELRALQLMSHGAPEDFATACTPTNASQNLWSDDPSEWGEGFISAYSPDQFALLEKKTPYPTIWAPYYTLHKLMAGFIDAYTYAGNEEALDIAKDLGKWVYRRLSECTTPELRAEMWSMYIAGEYGGMNESMARLYNITGNIEYLECAKLFDNTNFFNNLVNNIDDIKTRHANQHIPQIVGTVQEYLATGEEKYYNIAENFWNMVIARYAYSIGGVGQGENFRQPYQLAASIDSDKNCETCAAYNMLKLTKELNAFDPDNAKYMDYYERVLVNQIMGSQNPDVSDSMHNGVTYMYPIGPGAVKTYSDDYGSFTCCHGTGMENHVKYQEAAYFKSAEDDTLYVGLYIPSTVNWEEKGVQIQQECEFPASSTKLTIQGNGDFDLKLRVPYWATAGFTIEVNGKVVVSDAEPSTYVSAGTKWNDGDVITVSMPFTAHIDKTPDKLDGKTVASVMYGPLVMVTHDESADFLTLMLPEDLTNNYFITTNGPDGNNLYTMDVNGRRFVPIYSTHDYIPYHTYFYLLTLGEVESNVNKTELYSKIEAACTYQAVNYTSGSYSVLSSAIVAAAEIYRKADATEEEIDMQITALDRAIAGLIRKSGSHDDSGSSSGGTSATPGVSGTVISPMKNKAGTIVTESQVRTAFANLGNKTPIITVNALEDGITTFEKAAVKAFADRENTSLIIRQGSIELAFSNEALDTISANATGNIVFTARPAEKTRLTDNQRKTVGDRPVYDFSVMSNGVPVTNFNGNVSVSLPYTLKPGENPNAVVIYYVDASGQLQAVENCVYDSVSGTISWTADHFSLYLIGYNYVSFSDIRAHWARDTVEQLAARGLVNGMGNGLYQPDRAITRAEFLQMVQNVLKLPETAGTEEYADIAGDHWCYNAIMAAKSAGLLKGISLEGNNFMPNRAITREEMAVVLANAAAYRKLYIPMDALDLSARYKDFSEINADYLEEIQAVVRLGLMSGTGTDRFDPAGTATRSQAAQVQMNILKVFK